jgi:hypothetical protein
VNCRDHNGGNCPGLLWGRGFLMGRVPFALWECDTCHRINDPRIARRLEDLGRRLIASGRIDRTEPEPDPEDRPMKRLKMSVSRKGGAPNYGSDGVGLELEIELDDDSTLQQVADFAAAWYATLEATVDKQLTRMQAKHQEQPEQQAEQTRPVPARRETGRPMREPGDDSWSEEDEPQSQYVPPRRQSRSDRDGGGPDRNGYGGRQAQRSGGGGQGPPQSGKELLGWANNNDRYQDLLSLAKAWDVRGRIVDLGRDDVTALYNELMRPAGRYGRN